MSSKIKFEITNMSSIVQEVKKKFKETGNIYLPPMLETRNALEPSRTDSNLIRENPGGAKFACFHGDKPISPQQYALLYIAAVGTGSTAEKERLTLVELRYLKKYYPDEYDAWTKSGHVAATWTAGANNINSIIKTEIEKAKTAGKGIGGGTLQNITVNLYDSFISAHGSAILPNTPPLVLSKPVDYYISNKIAAWQEIAQEYVTLYLDPRTAGQSVKKDDSIIDKFMGNKKLTIECIDVSGVRFAIFGIILYNRNFENSLRININREIGIEKDSGSSKQNVDVTNLSGTNIGHWQEGASQTVYYNYKAYRALAAEILSDKSDPDNRKIAKEILRTINSSIRPTYRESWRADKLVFDRAAFALKSKMNSKDFEKQMSAFYEIANLMGVKQIGTITVINGALALPSSNIVTQHFEFNSNVFFIQDEDENQSRGGGNAVRRKSAIETAAGKLARTIVTGFAFREGSSSPVEQALLLALQEALNPLDPTMNSIKSKIIPSKRKTVKVVQAKKRESNSSVPADRAALSISNLVDSSIKSQLRALKGKNPNLNKARKTKKLNNTRVKGRLPISATIPSLSNNNSLMDKLNLEIRAAVMEQMRAPALQNRTGRFADSVRITSTTDRAINYSYKRDPYAVFSRRIGKPPWNSVRERDPHTIIQKAIRKIVADSYMGAIKEDT